MRQLQDMQAQLHAAQEKLRRAGMEVTPDRTRPSNVPLPAAETPELNSDVSCSVPVDPPLPKRQKTQPSAKTSATQRSLQAMFAASAPSGAPVQEDAAMTMSPDQVLEPKAPSLRSHPLVSTTGPSVKKWYESFDTETQQMAKKIIESSCSKSSATAKNAFRLPPRSMGSLWVMLLNSPPNPSFKSFQLVLR